MNRNIIKVSAVLGTLAVSTALMASMLSDKQNREKAKEALDNARKKANDFASEVKKEYQEIDKNLSEYIKTPEYKKNFQEVAFATKEIVEQLQILKDSTTKLLSSFKREMRKD